MNRAEKSGKKFVESLLHKAIKPQKPLTVTEWAEANRLLTSDTSSEPGRYRMERTPYLREIADSLSISSPYRKIVFMAGAQVGKTETGNNWIGYVIDYAPAPMMMVFSDKELAKEQSKIRIDPLIQSTPQLREKVSNARDKGRSDTRLMKEFPGGYLAIVGAQSPAGLRSKPIRFAYEDEVDSYKGDVGGEGDPTGLVRARMATFRGREKEFLTSTPTLVGSSRIANEFYETDMRKYFVPCPYCGKMQVLDFDRMRWSERNNQAVDVFYECEACAGHIRNHHKTSMLKNGEWRATNLSPKATDSIGFHLSALYSPVGWKSWEDCVTQYLSAQRDETKMKVFYNTVLGLPYEQIGTAPNWERLYNISARSSYQRGNVPRDGMLITAGADVQGDRIECEVVAWGMHRQSFSIDYHVFPGKTSDPQSDAWIMLQSLIDKQYVREDGAIMTIRTLAVDRGYNRHAVDAFCRKFVGNRVIPVHGSDSLLIPISRPRQLSVTLPGKQKVRVQGYFFYNVGSSFLKEELYSRLNLEYPKSDTKFPEGWCMFPSDYDQEYFKQLTAELYSPPAKAGAIGKWTLPSHRRNEALDCRNYARAAASLLQIETFTFEDWQKIDGKIREGKMAQKKEKSGRRVLNNGIKVQ